MIAFDTETTGLDSWHGCRPFIVSAIDENGKTTLWRQSVNPFTREVEPFSNGDKVSIFKLLDETDIVICHNAKFDIRMLEMSGIPLPKDIWDKIHDTILASHTLASAGPHGLKELGSRYLDISMDDEEATRIATLAARRIGKKLGWRIAEACDPHWPTLKSGQEWWKADLWMPHELKERVNHDKLDLDALGDDVTETYAIRDVERTIGLWVLFSDRLREIDQWKRYEVRRQNLHTCYKMESRGLTLRRFRTTPVRVKHETLAAKHQRECLITVREQIDNLNSPKQLSQALFSILGLPILRRTAKSGQPSTDKETLESLRDDCTPISKPGWFLKHLLAYRKRTHAGETVQSWENGAIPYDDPLQKNFACLHHTINITGTDTTRPSSTNPNGFNVAKGEGLPAEEGFNLRDLFGPALNRVWYSHDYSNIELRIFAYEADETEFIQAFEAGLAVHLIVARELYPREFLQCEKDGVSFKVRYERTLYQWIKNGNFSLIYGAGVKKADRTYHLNGAYHKIRRRFKHIDEFMKYMHNEARTNGFITCLGGYRLQVPSDGPHKAVNYFVQGSAGWALWLSMNRIRQYLDTLVDHHLLLNIYDELIHDVPTSHAPIFPYHIKQLMEMSGDDLDIPLPVEMSRIRVSWDQDEDIPPLSTSRRKGPPAKNLILQ